MMLYFFVFDFVFQNRRSFIAKFTCDETTVGMPISMSEPSTKSYEMTIASSYACNGENAGGGGGSSSSGSAISIGTIILISFGGIIFFYCVIGYVLGARNNPDNGWMNIKGNTPHFNFWCALLPKLTWAGCCVTKDCLKATFDKVFKKQEGYEEIEGE